MNHISLMWYKFNLFPCAFKARMQMRAYDMEKADWNLVEINMKKEKKSRFAVKIHKIAIVFRR